MNNPKNLSERDKALYRMLRDVAQAQLPTPRHKDLAEALVSIGFRARPSDIGRIIYALKQANRIKVLNNGIGSSTLVYRIVGTRYQTMPREMADWSPLPAVPSSGDCAAYDAAVASREFARHESGEKPGPIVSVRPAYSTRSLVGCSAAMEAA